MIIVKKIQNFTRKIIGIMYGLSIKDDWKLIRKCDVLLIFDDVNRGEKLGGKAYSALMDSIGDEISEKGFKCSRFILPPSHLTGKRAYGEPVSANRTLAFLAVRRKICQALCNIFFIKTNSCEMPLRHFYKKLAETSGCKFVLAIHAPQQLCAQMHSMGIPVFEVLHGPGYNMISGGWENLENKYLPDGILALDDISFKTWSILETKGIKVRQIPNPWLKRFRNKKVRSNLPSEWVRPMQNRKKCKKTILITLAWGHDFDSNFPLNISNGVLHDELVEVIKNTKESICWLLRLHPAQKTLKRYRHHVKFVRDFVEQHSNCEWENATNLPLPHVLSICDGHITLVSSTTYEAAFFGVKTLILSPILRKDRFSDLIKLGFVERGPLDVEIIIDWVKKIKKIKPSQATASRGDWDKIFDWMLSYEKKELVQSKSLD